LGAVTAIWWCGTGSASAGGGIDGGKFQTSVLNPLCAFLQMTSCPQLPTLTQLVLEVAGLENASPEMVRYLNFISPTAAINAVNPPAGSPFAPSNVAPLAFFSPSVSGGQVAVTQPSDPLANSFFYAATNGTPQLPPDTLNLLYDYPPLTKQSFAKGQDVADIALPLVVLNSNGSERSVPTTIQVRGSSGCGQTSPCVTFTAVGNFLGNGTQTRSPADLGLNPTFVFASSPNLAASHAIFSVQVKLIVTQANDPAYFSNPSNTISLALPPVFINDELGFTATFLKPPTGLPIGMAPDAAQFTASFTNNTGANVPAVNAALAIATDGETFVSAPLP